VFRWITGMAIGAALLVLVVGCGGGDDSTTEVTKAEFNKQANAICAKGKMERKDAYEKYSEEVQARIQKNGPATPTVERELANKMVQERVVPSLEDQLEELEALGTPAAEEVMVSKMLKNLSSGTDEIEDGGVRQLVEGGKLLTFQEEAEGYGLTCTVF
jgi:hypothetical protein